MRCESAMRISTAYKYIYTAYACHIIKLITQLDSWLAELCGGRRTRRKLQILLLCAIIFIHNLCVINFNSRCSETTVFHPKPFTSFSLSITRGFTHNTRVYDAIAINETCTFSCCVLCFFFSIISRKTYGSDRNEVIECPKTANNKMTHWQ